jgi:hypothetical protein
VSGEPKVIAIPPLRTRESKTARAKALGPLGIIFVWRETGCEPVKTGRFRSQKRDFTGQKTVFLRAKYSHSTYSRVPIPYTSDTANLYRVETTRKAVILTMLSGEELKGNVFIHFSSYRPFELEDVSELFNADSPFFPLELEHSEVILVAKERVAEVAADRGESASDQIPRVGRIPTALLQIVLVGGEVRLGSIRLDAPPARARVLDYLNALTSRFLTLYTSNEARLINRSLIDRVRPLD